MNNRLLAALAVAGLVLASTSPSHGFDGFLRIDGVKGESADQRYREWIVVNAVGWGHQQAVTVAAGSRTLGRVQFQPFTVAKHVDSTSPGLTQMAADGRVIRQVLLDLVQQPGAPPFARVELQDVLITSYVVEGTTGAPQRPVEKLSFTFGKITWGAFPIQPDGRPGAETKAGWDVRTNQRF